MINFLYKGLLRDKNRSLYPIIVVALGVWLVVFFQAYITGFMGDWIDSSARFETGHVKIMTQAFDENSDQNPNDLAIIGVDEIIDQLEQEYTEMVWVERIHYGGLFDVPDKDGETRSQSPVFGYGIDLLSPGTTEIDGMNIKNRLFQQDSRNLQGLKPRTSCHSARCAQLYNAYTSLQYFPRAGVVGFVPAPTVSKDRQFIAD